MTFDELKKEIRGDRAVLFMEDVLSRRVRKFLRDVIAVLMIGFFAGVQLNFFPLFDQAYGVFFLLLAVLLLLAVAEAFYFSFYFRALDSILDETDENESNRTVCFEVAGILYHTYEDDITKGFLHHSLGENVMNRLGIFPEEVQQFLLEKTNALSAESLGDVSCIDHEGGISLVDYASAIFKKDEEFQSFLFANEIQEKEFIGATGWIEEEMRLSRLNARFWGRDHLGRIQGIAKDWAYGNAYTLLKYAIDVTDVAGGTLEGRNILPTETDAIEKVLCRNRDANVLLVGDDSVRKQQILALLAQRIRTGQIFPQLEHKRLFVVNTSLLADLAHEKATFEIEIIKILNESIEAGNIVLVFEDFPLFVSNARSLNSDVISLMGNYFGSAQLQIIAMSGVTPFHEILETNRSFMEYFEKVSVLSLGEDGIIETLQKNAIVLEKKNGVFITFPAILAVSEGATRYFSEGNPLDKALDILFELIPYARSKKDAFLEKKDVLEFLGHKTGIPTGEIKGEERAKLTGLEDTLRKRIIGQDEAVSAISNAMRRARSGVGNKDRPMGSFLFLGPTGVGKTETTKALAASFFDSESKIVRLDMSEYKTDDALSRLIGSFEGGKQGVLSSMLREHPYGVLLLDEFEKTNKEVLDLFLQIIDEGFFSDMLGKRVNARNLIIIATSNAGSDLIFKYVQEGKNLSEEKDSLINSIVERGLFKPELINRFDGVILFKPLDENALRQIAKLMLQKLQKRLRAKGVDLVINDYLINELVKVGTDPKFGARPMNRAVQDKVEQVIANRLISGEVKAGSKVELTEKDFM